MIKITIASDYRGIALKKELLINLELSKIISFTDIGIDDGSTLDYIDISKKLSDSLLFNSKALAVIICGTGHGVAIALNRFSHIRATTCNNLVDAINAREKLNANVLCIGGKYVDLELAKEIILTFSNTKFLSVKHSECVKKLDTTQTVHHKNGINLIVRAIITHQNHILLTSATEDNKNFAQGLFFLPGGHVEYNEPTLTALKRELREEMDLECQNEEFVAALECTWDRQGSIYHEIDIIYKIQIDNLSLNKPPIAMDHKFHRFLWKKIDEIKNLIILPNALKKIITNTENSTGLFISEILKK